LHRKVERIDVDVIVSFLEEGRRCLNVIVVRMSSKVMTDFSLRTIFFAMIVFAICACTTTKTFPCELAVETVKAFCGSPRQNDGLAQLDDISDSDARRIVVSLDFDQADSGGH
jgi:hypothetical protein